MLADRPGYDQSRDGAVEEMIVPINLRWEDHAVDFCMDLDTNCPTDYAVMHYVKQGVPCEPETVFVMLRTLQEGDIAVDAGANIGFFTLLMSKLVGPRGRVVAFEPDKRNLDKLNANIALNKCENVKVIPKALWSSQATVQLFLYSDAGANSLWGQNTGDVSVMVEATTLDHELGMSPHFIKLDVEGSELRALRGARLSLAGKPVIVMEMNEVALERAGSTFAEIRKMLAGYDCFGLSETGHFPVYIPAGVKMVAVKTNTNVMFSTLAQVQQRWAEARV